jgi:pilus assembly protein CpaB
MAICIATLLVVMVKNRSGGPVVESGPKVLVATADIPAGSFVRVDKNIGWAEWPKANISPSFIMQEAHKIDEYNGGVARRDIIAGEPLSGASVVKSNEGGFMSAVLASGKRAVSIAVNSTSGNAGFIFPGDRVDLIMTHKLPDNTLASETFIEDLRVLAIDQMLNNPDNRAVIAKTITLEVSPKQAEMINVAISIGTISVSLRSLAQGNDAKPEAHAAGTDKTTMPMPAESNYSTNSDVSKLMGDKGSGNSVSVFHGSASEHLEFHDGAGR